MKFTQRFISLLLCVILMLSLTCFCVSAKTVYPFGDWVVEKINNDTEFEVDVYNGDSADVTIPLYFNDLPITSVGSNAFNANEYLQSVTLDSPCVAIQSYAFSNCKSLTAVALNDEVSFIGDGAFSGCSALSEINLEDTQLTSLGFGTFMNCDALTEVTIPDTVTKLGLYTFGYCDNLTKITIPASVTSIDNNAFYNSKNVVIYCYTDSAAHVYAEEKGIEYVLLDYVEKYILGDTDNDGEITIIDATTVQLVLAWLVEDTDGRMSIRGDSDQDGVLSITDATAIQLYLASYETGTNLGQSFEY